MSKHSSIVFFDNNAWDIENSKIYTSIKNGTKTVEFLRLKDKKLLFIEAKETFSPPYKDNKYFEDISDISFKFIHSLMIFASTKFGVNFEILPNGFNCESWEKLEFILVVKNENAKGCRRIEARLKPIVFQFLHKKLDEITNVKVMKCERTSHFMNGDRG